MDNPRRDLPVLLLHNLDPAWTGEERSEAEEDVAALGDALKSLGHPVEVAAVEDARLAKRLAAFDPREHIVF
ncbi:MAG TPA: hypothetical protein PLX98_12865, partial [Candidatus Aminicenantes bacterium]|nr:hypothetical protein [Candidatus Aminicenantes bacterium]